MRSRFVRPGRTDRAGRRSVVRAKRVAALMALVCVVLPAVLATAAAGTVNAVSQAGSPVELSKHERGLVLAARAKGEDSITLMVASKSKANAKVAKDLESLGATVVYRADNLDYARASVPLDKLDAVLRLEGLLAADVDEEIALDDPRPGGFVNLTPQATPNPTIAAPCERSPRRHSTMPAKDEPTTASGISPQSAASR